MPYELRTAARTHVGEVREINEDSFFVSSTLLLVADGMGGHAAGEVASELAAESFEQITATEREPDSDLTVPLRAAIDRASHAIAVRIENEPELAGMGTTVTAAMFGPTRIVIANIGDSRTYVYRHESGELVQVTKDDSFVQLMVESGELTADEAQHHPYRNVMIKALNGDAVEPQFTTLPQVNGDRFLLCSDGLSDYVATEDIKGAITLPTVEEAADQLIALTLAAGAPDNVTVVLSELVATTGDVSDKAAIADAGGDDA